MYICPTEAKDTFDRACQIRDLILEMEEQDSEKGPFKFVFFIDGCRLNCATENIRFVPFTIYLNDPTCTMDIDLYLDEDTFAFIQSHVPLFRRLFRGTRYASFLQA